MNIIENNKDAVNALCEKYKVASLFLFGSYATGKFNSESDIDFLVTFDNDDLYNYFDNYYGFLIALENLFNKKIDLVSEKYIRNPYLKKSIDANKILIYERRPANMAA